MKGIILAGGKGTRLYPMTKVVSKQLLPIYDKPMIYYPLSVLILAKICEILIISTQNDIESYKSLLGDGSSLGISIQYATQNEPRGLAEAFLIGEDFIGKESVCLILGDNIFYGQNLTMLLEKATKTKDGALIFGYPVNNPSEYGIAVLAPNTELIGIEEKPKHPKSNIAVPGLYFYDNSVVDVAKHITPSDRGELEITAVNNAYLNKHKLSIELLGRGMAWLDTGTPESMLKAAEFVKTVQSRQGLYIACIEEIAWRRGYITTEELSCIGNKLATTNYGKYILSLCTGK